MLVFAVGKGSAGDLVLWVHKTVRAVAFRVSPKVRHRQQMIVTAEGLWLLLSRAVLHLVSFTQILLQGLCANSSEFLCSLGVQVSLFSYVGYILVHL